MQPGMMAGYRWERQKGRLSERAEPGVQQLPQEGFLEEAGWPKTDERIEMAEEAERNGKWDGPGFPSLAPPGGGEAPSWRASSGGSQVVRGWCVTCAREGVSNHEDGTLILEQCRKCERRGEKTILGHPKAPFCKLQGRHWGHTQD